MSDCFASKVALQNPRFGIRHERRLQATLLFDSMLAAPTSGVRSSSKPSRQLLYGAGEHRIDVRIEPKIDAEKVAIIGQILSVANPAQVLSNIPVSLYLGKRLLACSQTNGQGEFELECDLLGKLELRATLPQGATISVSLIEPASSYLPDSKDQSDFFQDGERHRTKKKV